MTVNLAIDAGRRKTPQLAPEVPETIEDLTITRLALAEALHRLSTRQRAVVGLRFLEGLTEAEVAQKLGISIGSVKTHGHRGLAALREALAPKETNHAHP